MRILVRRFHYGLRDEKHNKFKLIVRIIGESHALKGIFRLQKNTADTVCQDA